jgi:hypothetical protein
VSLRSEGMPTDRTSGFTYLEQVDAWECPEGERLHRVETDQRMRLARYRARAHVCNSCRLKEACIREIFLNWWRALA